MLRLFIVCASCATAGTLLVALVPSCRGPFFVVPWSVAQSALVLETCPSVVRFVFQRPLYVEMLEDPLSDDDMQPDEIQFRRKLRTGFDHLLIVATALALGCVVEYGLYKYDDVGHDMSLIELLGVSGGLFSIFKKLHTVAGNALLRACLCLRSRHDRRRRLSSTGSTASVTTVSSTDSL